MLLKSQGDQPWRRQSAPRCTPVYILDPCQVCVILVVYMCVIYSILQMFLRIRFQQVGILHRLMTDETGTTYWRVETAKL